MRVKGEDCQRQPEEYYLASIQEPGIGITPALLLKTGHHCATDTPVNSLGWAIHSGSFWLTHVSTLGLSASRHPLNSLAGDTRQKGVTVTVVV